MEKNGRSKHKVRSATHSISAQVVCPFLCAGSYHNTHLTSLYEFSHVLGTEIQATFQTQMRRAPVRRSFLGGHSNISADRFLLAGC